MADIKISDLSAAGTLTGTEEIPIVQSSTTVKATAQDIADLSTSGTNIGTNNLTITDATRKLIMQGSTSGETFSIRDTSDTSNLWSIDGGGVVTFNEAFSFPTTDGTANQVLETDGAGTLTWATAGGGGGSNIANSDLTISATGTRKLTMAGSASTDIFKLRDSADNFDMFSFGGDGGQAIGWKAVNTGTNRWGNTCVGNLTDNNGYFGVTAIGSQAKGLQSYGTAVGYQAKAGLNSTAIGWGANASLGQYNISIGESASCSAYFGIAIGRYASAADRGLAINATANTYGTALNGNAGGYAVAVGRNSNAGNHATAIGFDTDVTNIAVAVGRGMETSGIYSVSIGACPYGQVRTNAVANTFNWFTNNANPIVRFAETADQWNIGSGSFGYGTITPDASAVIDLTSTSKGFLPPRMTTTERDAISTPAEGLVIYNTTTQVLNFYNGSSWGAV